MIHTVKKGVFAFAKTPFLFSLSVDPLCPSKPFLACNEVEKSGHIVYGDASVSVKIGHEPIIEDCHFSCKQIQKCRNVADGHGIVCIHVAF